MAVAVGVGASILHNGGFFTSNSNLLTVMQDQDEGDGPGGAKVLFCVCGCTVPTKSFVCVLLQNSFVSLFYNHRFQASW